MTKCEC